MRTAPAELTDLQAAVRGVLDRHWPHECRISRETAPLAEMWKQAIEHGWLDLAGDDELPAVLRILEELGAANCGLPVLDAFVAQRILRETDVAERIASGEATVVVGRAAGGAPAEYLEAAQLATHVLVLPPDGTTAELRPLDPATLELTPSIGPQAWARQTVAGEPELTVDVRPDELQSALRLLRLGLVVRALGAARRAHVLALGHANTREQFGQAIGRFQAVSHRAATCMIDLESSRVLVEAAIDAEERDPESARLTIALATTHGIAAAPRVVLGALHTLGGIGFHEEHEGAWLFRRVHGDVARAAGFESAVDDPSRMLIEEGRAQPSVDLGEDANAFRAEVSAFFDANWSTDRVLDPDAQFDLELRRGLVEKGWLGAGWPKEWGGLELTPEELLVLNEEVRYRGVPVRRLFTTVNIVGAAILQHGTEAQKNRYLPGIKRGETLFCLGYSEPGAGSDLASLRTSAAKTDGGWVVNGQKIFTTFGHRSQYHWLAVRTDADATPQHAGISVFIVPLDSPGITIQQNHALNGETTCTTFYDNVFVARRGRRRRRERRLAGDRHRPLGRTDPDGRQRRRAPRHPRRAPRGDALGSRSRTRGRPGSWQRQAVVDIAAWLAAVRLFVVWGLNAMAAGTSARLPAAMAKVASGETAEKLADAGLRILGPDAALAAGAPGAILNGTIERMLRMAPMYVIGGGTNDIQRNLIARDLGLPR